ncbi:Nicotinate phosphoribosyltransferase domain containing 1 [Cichlidogyrus casuarinus]|uniref:Nicotinate phosphoribosyltransferase n=1 Tax=Cichlidogyrus casuarinus TaxID=1844966 RepID=A0ABD2PL90_9PLAT
MEEGSFAFPKVPLMIVDGSLIVCQLIESSLLNLVNFASLICTNAIRHRIIVGREAKLYEFGMRRAQGPNGALTASKYSFLGGFDATSNVLAGKVFNIPVVGTHAHSFVSSFTSLQQQHHSSSLLDTENESKMDVDAARNAVKKRDKCEKPTSVEQLRQLAHKWLAFLAINVKSKYLQVGMMHKGDLEAFCNYAFAFPGRFLALIDTYDTLHSGLPSFCAVALALAELGYQAKGVRIDSGDLAYQSIEIHTLFSLISQLLNLDPLTWMVVASNDLDEDTIRSLGQQGHRIDAFAVGTNLVTCKKQPSMGCVYKLVQINGQPSVKLSANMEKASLPGSNKHIYSLVNHFFPFVSFGENNTSQIL